MSKKLKPTKAETDIVENAAKEKNLTVLELREEVRKSCDEMSQTFFKLACEVSVKVDSLSSATLKRLLKCLVFYPHHHPESDNLQPNHKEILNLATKNKDLYVEYGRIVHKLSILEKFEENSKKSSESEDESVRDEKVAK